MPFRVYFDNKGKVYFQEPLNEAVFFIPEGTKIERIDLTDPENPVAIVVSQEAPAELMGTEEENEPEAEKEEQEAQSQEEA